MTKQFCNLNSDYLHEDLHSLHCPFSHKTYYIRLFCRLEGKLRHWLMPGDYPLLTMPCDLPLLTMSMTRILAISHDSTCQSLFCLHILTVLILAPNNPFKGQLTVPMHLSPVPYPFLLRIYFWSLLKATSPCKP